MSTTTVAISKEVERELVEKLNKESTTNGFDDFKDHYKYNSSKYEYDLYHDEYNTVEKVFHIKRISLPNKEERWKMFQDNKVLFTIEGNKCTKKEREFLRTIDGFNWLLAEFKKGINSFNAFKKAIRIKLNGG